MLTFRRRLRVVSTGTAVTLMLALVLSSCGESKVSQCNRLAEVVNKAQGFMPEFESNIQAFSENAAQVESLDDIKSAADEYIVAVNEVVTDLEGLVGELDGTELSDEELTKLSRSLHRYGQGFRRCLKSSQ